ncbi:hypothetical protein RYZ26_15345 [Terasakiella sp. A23]|uniref:hypothetical protein n=1 Tax=Terasakiella sp. FCG-A23 TaxID=3080561 RepID=UPI002954519F|nr:hypothetical protein [Terasakiella sp. A23]MDV7340980.1 hypothetical protein [Terasakiella sp. A23]
MARIHFCKNTKVTSMEGVTIDFNDALMQDIADCYDPKLQPAPLVFGHPKTEDKSHGWVDAIEFSDKGLFAEASQVSASFSEAFEKGEYRTVSASFFLPKAPNNPVPGKFYLRHIGALGAAVPAIKGLDAVQFSDNEEDILTVDFANISGWTIADIGRGFLNLKKFLLSKFDPEEVNAAIADFPAEGLIEEGAYQAGKEAGETISENSSSFSDPDNPEEEDMSTKELEAQKAALAKEREEFEKEKEAVEKDKASFADQQATATAAAFIAPLVAAGKILPAEEAQMVSFMAGLSENETVSFADGDEEKEKSQRAIFQDFVEALPSRVNFSEVTGDNGDTIDFSDADALSAAVRTYIAEQKEKGFTVTSAEAVQHLKGK